MSRLFDKLREGKNSIDDIIAQIASNPPSFDDPRDYEHYDKPAFTLYADYDRYVGNIEDQKNKQRCVFQSWEVFSRVQTNRDRLINFGTEMVDFDAQALYEKAKECDGYPDIEGTPPRMGPKMLKKYGLTELSPNNGDIFKIKNYWKCKKLKHAINDLITIGPVVITVRWYMSFFFGDGLLVPKSNDKYIGLHNITLTKRDAKDVSEGVLSGVNSYGVAWGSMGRFVLPENQWKNLVVEAYCAK